MMGKLVDKLRQVGQAGSGGLGFLARAQTQKPRPAAIFVSIGAGDTAAAEAALKSGADGVIVSSWTRDTDLSALTAAAAAASAVLGVALAAEGVSGQDELAAARTAGASFAVADPATPARLLFEDVDQLDLVVTVDMPHDDLGLVLLRGENLLPAHAALLRAPLRNADLARLTVADFARLRLARESLRFPTLAPLAEAPDAANVRLLVRLGLNGLILPGEGVSASALGAQIKALREELEKTPAEDSGRGSIAIGGLMEAAGQSPHPPQQPHPTRREPQREPDEE
jgi:hypothetical protein